MKFRIIICNRKFIAQVKTHWWTFWEGLHWSCASEIYFTGINDEHSTLEQAIVTINEYKDQLVDHGKVVWEGT